MPEQSKVKKVDISFTNWVLGGSLVSVTDGQGRRQAKSRKVAVLEVSDSKPLKAATGEKKNDIIIKAKGSSRENKKDKGNEKDNYEAKSKEEDGKGQKKDVIKEGSADAKKCCKECGHSSDDGSAGKDGESKNNEDTSDEAKKEKSKADDSEKNGETKSFTDVQDFKIKDMKANNKSWKEIAIEVGASKKDVIARFKVLSDADEKNEASTSMRVNNAENVVKDGSSEGAKANTGDLDFESLFLEDTWGVTSTPADGADEPKMDGGSKADGKKKSGGKGSKSGKSQNSTGGEIVSGGNGDGGGGTVSGSSYEGGYPELKPNAIWSESDCDLLMFLEARYMEEKWLQMQAGFFNWTGRMVDAEIIKAKFAEDGLI